MIGRRTFDFSRQIIVMGIVNRTPDSFFDQGRTYGLDEAVTAALAADKAGAGWVDIGGVPFSPDTPEVDEAEEIDRVLPVVAAVAGASDIVISVDTFRPEVAARCLAAGASVINDTTGLQDRDLAAVVAAGQASVVITHSKAQPRQHFPRPHYDDIASEIKNFLMERVQRAVDAGVPENKIILDPGHDLNKNTLHSLELTRRLTEIADIGLPLLAAVSNKDFVGEATGFVEGRSTGANHCRRHGVHAERGTDSSYARCRPCCGGRAHGRGDPGVPKPCVSPAQPLSSSRPICLSERKLRCRDGRR